MRARYYNPHLNQFIQPDRIVPQLEAPQDWNKYSYARNNPIRYVDPTGYIYTDPSGNTPYSLGGDIWEWYMARYINRPCYVSLPVDPEQITWIQWFGGTQYAFDEGYMWNYDGYCQGFHCGIDLAAPWGTPVRAGTRGRVVATWGNDSDEEPDFFGRYRVDIKVGRWKVIYAHLDGNLRVGVGDYVRPGTIIAGVGNPDGNPRGGNNHAHIEIRLNNQSDLRNNLVHLVYNPLLFVQWNDYKALQQIAKEQAAEEDDASLVTFYSTDAWAGYPDPMLQPVIQRGGTSLWP